MKITWVAEEHDRRERTRQELSPGIYDLGPGFENLINIKTGDGRCFELKKGTGLIADRSKSVTKLNFRKLKSITITITDEESN